MIEIAAGSVEDGADTGSAILADRASTREVAFAFPVPPFLRLVRETRG